MTPKQTPLISSGLPATSGLVSVSFRQLSPAAIVDLAKQANLKVIEWGGDIHVPSGDIANAREIAEITQAAGLQVAAYGSYYRLGDSAYRFESILETASALNAPVIRVWAGSLGSNEADESLWASVCSDAERVAELASEQGVSVAMEFHGGTLNDSPVAANRLWNELEHPALRSLWQPLPTLTSSEQDESLSLILPHLSHLHVFHWFPGPPIERRPLSEGVVSWSRWLRVVSEFANCSGQKLPPALLEFVVEDNPENLLADATTLHKLLAS